ncbi:hypothetical protein DFP72DRAFT_860334 [Ephemerocybe angulata]|uniref:Transcription factor TFIID subunit 8 C-terminal domain-containing protein n=1 Tax=Ephemerocybe angulata TaxID=980116 RepID=A0A8H6H912_9AGAR|nr:hypothetical protein DFP72DRAFT_860334 [Tulosesus angulatus]
MYQPQHESPPPPSSSSAAVAQVAASAAYLNPYYASAYNTPTPPLDPNAAVSVAGPIVAPGALSYYAFNPAAAQTPREVVPTPAEPTVTPQVADAALRKLVTLELRNAGFERADAGTVGRLEVEGCEEHYLPMDELKEVERRSRRKKRQLNPVNIETVLVPPKSRSPSPDLLDSDEEGTTPAVPLTLRALPSHFPSLPPKHTYMKTPVSPPKKAALPSLEKKLKTAGLVQKSLQNLLTATEENTNNEDAELLGHIVNWETGLHPRKRLENWQVMCVFIVKGEYLGLWYYGVGCTTNS